MRACVCVAGRCEQEVVKRVVMQGDTQKQLEEMKEGNIRQLSLLREEKKKLVTQLEELKYSQNNNLSSGRQMLKELDSHVKQEKERQENELERLTYIIHIMMLVKAGVEHLSNKLRHIQMVPEQRGRGVGRGVRVYMVCVCAHVYVVCVCVCGVCVCGVRVCVCM
uniref:Coiled-coil domain-containing protein 151-like n=1 Tax=Callorhinchus milii TaxID=7868 RepID=A0A4W3H6P5_CALMI